MVHNDARVLLLLCLGLFRLLQLFLKQDDLWASESYFSQFWRLGSSRRRCRAHLVTAHFYGVMGMDLSPGLLLGFPSSFVPGKRIGTGTFCWQQKKDNLLRKGKHPSPKMCGASEQGLEAYSPVWATYRTLTSLFVYPVFFLSMQLVVCTLDWDSVWFFLNNQLSCMLIFMSFCLIFTPWVLYVFGGTEG